MIINERNTFEALKAIYMFGRGEGSPKYDELIQKPGESDREFNRRADKKYYDDIHKKETPADSHKVYMKIVKESYTISEGLNYDPFKKDMKKVKDGPYTDGWGNSYKIGRTKSDSLKYKGFDFIYDYKDNILTMSKDGEELGVQGLSISNWLDNCEYWIEKLYRESH